RRFNSEDSNKLFKILAENSQAGAYIVQDRKFHYVNPSFLRFSGYTEGELLGADALSLVVPEDRDLVVQNAVQMLKGKLSSPYRFRISNKNGDIKWIVE